MEALGHITKPEYLLQMDAKDAPIILLFQRIHANGHDLEKALLYFIQVYSLSMWDSSNLEYYFRYITTCFEIDEFKKKILIQKITPSQSLMYTKLLRLVSTNNITEQLKRLLYDPVFISKVDYDSFCSDTRNFLTMNSLTLTKFVLQAYKRGLQSRDSLLMVIKTFPVKEWIEITNNKVYEQILLANLEKQTLEAELPGS